MTAAPGDVPMARRLPRRPPIHSGQALDSYLEQVAAANHMTTADLTKRVAGAGDTTRFLMLAPTATTLRGLSAITGQPVEHLENATLHWYDGTALNLTGLDPQRQASYRTVAGRGWLPGVGSQICPGCLAETGAWQLAWRLPTTTVCTTHRRYLVSTCPDCGMPFRATRHGYLRPVGASLACGNPAGARGRHCRTELTALVAARSDRDCLDRQRRCDRAMLEGSTLVFGDQTDAAAYHQALRSVTVLLLHIATAAPDRHKLPPWARRLKRSLLAESTERGTRWGITPPRDTVVRSRALTSASHILDAHDIETAAKLFAPWAEAVPHTPDGFLGWAGDHTAPEPFVTRLILAVHSPRRRLSRALDDTDPAPPRLEGVPQVIPQDLYEQFLAELCEARPESVRTFAALCLARTHSGVDTWSRAAQVLGLGPEIGRKAAQTCTAAMTAAPGRFAAALTDLASHLPDQNYRVCEQGLRELGQTDEWFIAWVLDHRPGTRPSSKAHALTWLWLVTAHGHLSTSPGAPRPLDARGRAYYRRFAQSLTDGQQAALSLATEQVAST